MPDQPSSFPKLMAFPVSRFPVFPDSGRFGDFLSRFSRCVYKHPGNGNPPENGTRVRTHHFHPSPNPSQLLAIKPSIAADARSVWRFSSQGIFTRMASTAADSSKHGRMNGAPKAHCQWRCPLLRCGVERCFRSFWCSPPRVLAASCCAVWFSDRLADYACRRFSTGLSFPG